MKKRTYVVGLLLASAAVGFLLGSSHPGDDDFFAIRKSFDIFGGVYEELVGSYVDRINPEQLMHAGIEAMLNELDPYTVFFDEADNADMEIITRGAYGGVGLNVGIRNGRITIVAPIEGASGYKQGVRAGDIMLTIEDRPVDDLTLRDVQNLLRGDPGTTVRISVERQGTPDPIDFVLMRQEVKLSNVSYAAFLEGTDIAYVKLDRFAQDAAREVRDAIQSLRETREPSGWILDLRDNPGGLLDAAVDIAGLFLPRGSVVVSTDGRLAETKRVFASRRAAVIPDAQLVILVNELSASASEIVAGAVQDLDRGVIIGDRTFGKGLVQIFRELPHNTSLKLTTSRYYTPSGRSIQSVAYRFGHRSAEAAADSLTRTFTTTGGRAIRGGHGIEPDVVVRAGKSSLEDALERRAAFFLYANRFAAENATVDPSFRPDDRLLESFRTWLDGQNFTFDTPADAAIRELESSLEESDIRNVRTEVNRLKQAVKLEKEKGFERHRESLRERLRAEILARYHGDTEQIRASLSTDIVVAEAVSIIGDTDRYESILAGAQ